MGRVSGWGSGVSLGIPQYSREGRRAPGGTSRGKNQHYTGGATMLVKLFPDWLPDSLKPVAVLGGEEKFSWLRLDPVGRGNPQVWPERVGR